MNIEIFIVNQTTNAMMPTVCSQTQCEKAVLPDCIDICMTAWTGSAHPIPHPHLTLIRRRSQYVYGAFRPLRHAAKSSTSPLSPLWDSKQSN